jgi:DNA-binding response OmpR family regulator
MEYCMAQKVLVIDDSHLMGHVLETELGRKGFEVIVAFDAQSGLQKAREVMPDIVILDLILPDMPGEEVCRELKQSAGTEHIPVIMLTGKDSDVDRVIGKVLGAQSYIAKPFEFDHLMSEIARLIAMILMALSLSHGSIVSAADRNETQRVPPGMELIKVGEHSVYVAKGTRVTQRGSQLVLEPPDEFVARKLLFLEEEIAALRAKDELLRQQIQDLKAAIERLAPRTDTEAGNGSK